MKQYLTTHLKEVVRLMDSQPVRVRIWDGTVPQADSRRSYDRILTREPAPAGAS